MVGRMWGAKKDEAARRTALSEWIGIRVTAVGGVSDV